MQGGGFDKRGGVGMATLVHPNVAGGFPAEGKDDTNGDPYIPGAAQGWVAQTPERIGRDEFS